MQVGQQSVEQCAIFGGGLAIIAKDLVGQMRDRQPEQSVDRTTVARKRLLSQAHQHGLSRRYVNLATVLGDGNSLLENLAQLGLERAAPARSTLAVAGRARMAAATAPIGVATADLYPRITLGGSIASAGTGVGSLFGAGSLNWLLGPLIS